MSIVAVHGLHTWGQPFFAQSDQIIVNLLGPLDLEFKAKRRTDLAFIPDPYSWDLGDGTTIVNGFEVLHTFSDPGTFVVTLTVQTKTGPVTDQIEITLDGSGNGHRAEVTELQAARKERKVA